MTSSLASFTLFLLFSIASGNLPSVYQKIYTDITGIAPCFRLSNATSQIGCSATPHNVSGTVGYASTQDEVDDLLNNPPHSPYIVILEPELFTSTNVVNMHNSKHINGILIRYLQDNIADLNSLMSFSPAKKCPNDGFGPNGFECRDWNTNGSDLSFEDFDKFAVFALTNNDSYNTILQCYKENNVNLNGGYSDYPLCTAELRADMMSVGSTQECYQRGNVWTNLGVAPCDPLGDENVWGTLFELRPEQNIIMIATKLDSTAFFPYLAYGANNELAGIVTLLAVAKVLGDMKQNGELVDTTDAIMFTFFQGESWDYIGSSRMVYDMLQDVFPYAADSGKEQPPRFGLPKVKAFIELSHVGIQSDPSTVSPIFYLHSQDDSLMSALQDGSNQYNLTFTRSSSTSLPPASAQMFLRENGTVPVAIISDYDQHYNNRFFGSRYDVLENLIGSDVPLDSTNPVVLQLTSLASAVANTVLNLSIPSIPDGRVGTPKADPELISELLYCFLQETNCSYFKDRLSYNVESVLTSSPLSRYVTTNTVSNTETSIVHELLTNFTGEVIPNNTNCDNCTTPDNVQTYTLLNQSNNCICSKAYTHRHTATSPAFINGNYSSTYYSTWTESRWTAIGMRIYVVTHVGLEVGLFFAGLIVTVIAFLVTCQCYRKGREIFAVSTRNIIAKPVSSIQ